MRRFEVTYLEKFEREITCIVEAMNEYDAKRKARIGETLESDEDENPIEPYKIDFVATPIDEEIEDNEDTY